MTEYRAGQRVRIEWPDGSAVEGIVKVGCGFAGGDPTPCLDVPRSTMRIFLSYSGTKTMDGGNVTVLSEPRPEEPTGLGAVVEALFHSPEMLGEARQVWVRRVIRDDAHLPQQWVSEDGHMYAPWNYLEDPVVLREGWHRGEVWHRG